MPDVRRTCYTRELRALSCRSGASLYVAACRGRQSSLDRLNCFWMDESGGSATEYALTLGVIGGCVVLMSIGLGYAIGGAMNGATSCIGGHCASKTAASEPAQPAPTAADAAMPPAEGSGNSAAEGSPDAKPGKGKGHGKGCSTWSHCKSYR